jgi:hypothetical protein
MKCLKEMWNGKDSLDKKPKLRQIDTRFGTWNVRSLYQENSLITVVKELSNYNLHFVGVHEVRWDTGGIKSAGTYTFFYGRRHENNELGTGFFMHISHIGS